MNKHLTETINHLKTKKKILFLTTSNRRSGSHETPKSTQLATHITTQIWTNKITQIDINELTLYPCEGNVSWLQGNTCGLIGAKLKDTDKNPTGFHRCRANINHDDDELRKVSKALFESEVVVFFTSVRRGQANASYQKLIERLTRIENRQSTLWEENIVKNIEAGIIAMGHNRNNEQVIQTQKEVLESFGFIVPKQLCRWWIDADVDNETQQWYQDATAKFEEDFGFSLDH